MLFRTKSSLFCIWRVSRFFVDNFLGFRCCFVLSFVFLIIFYLSLRIIVDSGNIKRTHAFVLLKQNVRSLIFCSLFSSAISLPTAPANCEIIGISLSSRNECKMHIIHFSTSVYTLVRTLYSFEMAKPVKSVIFYARYAPFIHFKRLSKIAHTKMARRSNYSQYAFSLHNVFKKMAFQNFFKNKGF